MSKRRYFTVSEVNALIPELEARVRRIQELREELYRKLTALKAQKRSAPPGADFMQAEAEIDFLLILLRSSYQGIEALGGVIKSADATLVDFLGRGPNGEDVWLCWRYGEQRCEYYHPLDEGFAGRRPVVPGM